MILVDGEWGAWCSWSKCTVSCGEGVHSRTRLCNNPKPYNGGKTCAGLKIETGYCNTEPCHCKYIFTKVMLHHPINLVTMNAHWRLVWKYFYLIDHLMDSDCLFGIFKLFLQDTFQEIIVFRGQYFIFKYPWQRRKTKRWNSYLVSLMSSVL